MTRVLQLHCQECSGADWGRQYSFLFKPTCFVNLEFNEVVTLQSVSVIVEFADSSGAKIFQHIPWHSIVRRASIQRGGSTITSLDGGRDGVGIDLVMGNDSFVQKVFLQDSASIVAALPFSIHGSDNYCFELDETDYFFAVELQRNYKTQMNDVKLQLQYSVCELPLRRKVIDCGSSGIFDLQNFDGKITFDAPKKCPKGQIRFIFVIVQNIVENSDESTTVEEFIDTRLVIHDNSKDSVCYEEHHFSSTSGMWLNSLGQNSVRCAAELSSMKALVLPVTKDMNEKIQTSMCKIVLEKNKYLSYREHYVAVKVAYDFIPEKEETEKEEPKTLEDRIARLEKIITSKN